MKIGNFSTQTTEKKPFFENLWDICGVEVEKNQKKTVFFIFRYCFLKKKEYNIQKEQQIIYAKILPEIPFHGEKASPADTKAEI